jgi:hypothetical protein
MLFIEKTATSDWSKQVKPPELVSWYRPRIGVAEFADYQLSEEGDISGQEVAEAVEEVIAPSGVKLITALVISTSAFSIWGKSNLR